MSWWTFPELFATLIPAFTATLDKRSGWRLEVLFVGLIFASGRRTITSWLRAANIQNDFQRYYPVLSAVGKSVKCFANILVIYALSRIWALAKTRILLVLDDTTTKRVGPCVQGAGRHYDGSPGPADSGFLWGHSWVVLAAIGQHPKWFNIALPILSKLYIRECDVNSIPDDYQWKFQTKVAIAAEMIRWIAGHVKNLGRQVHLVVDGGYAKRGVLAAAAAVGVVIIGRLRKDAALFTLPERREPGQRGRPRKYGRQRIDFAGRANHREGWTRGTFLMYGERQGRLYKTFLSTWRPAGGVIRVVIIRDNSRNPVSYFSTNPNLTVQEIVEAVAARNSIEQCFHDLKETWGTAQVQLRNLWANLGALYLSCLALTLSWLWAWPQPDCAIVDRRDSPWDRADRRPSAADVRRSLQGEMLRNHFCQLNRVLTRNQNARPFVARLVTLYSRLKWF